MTSNSATGRKSGASLRLFIIAAVVLVIAAAVVVVLILAGGSHNQNGTGRDHLTVQPSQTSQYGGQQTSGGTDGPGG